LALGDIAKLIDAGKEKGYLTYNEVNDLIPHDVHSPEDLGDLLATVGTRGIDVLEGRPKLRFSAFEKKLDKEVGAAAKSNSIPPVTPSKRTTIQCGYTCAKWARCPYSPEMGKGKLPSASSADNCKC
jgi:hypothetical protein